MTSSISGASSSPITQPDDSDDYELDDLDAAQEEFQDELDQMERDRMEEEQRKISITSYVDERRK